MINGELIVDNFAGGGGASTGIEEATGYCVDIAINHDPRAIKMHKANHPYTKHYCEDVWQVDPVKVCGGHPVALAWFSPDCKHFSKAKGGKPKDKFIRGLAWVACRWAGLVRPLAKKTMDRIARGIKKFILDNPEPFLIQCNHGGERKPGDIRQPMPTITGKHGFGVVAPILIQYHSETTQNETRGQGIEDPLMTVDGSNRYGLVTSFISKFYKSGTGQDIREPLHTVTTSPGHFGEVRAFLTKYYGTGTGQDIKAPLDTITAQDRFGLVTIYGTEYQIVDIGLRMLAPKELYGCQGFPDDYIIDRDCDGKPYLREEQVRRCGNAVCPPIPTALVRANLKELCVAKRLPNCRADRLGEDAGGQLRFA